MTRAQRKKLDRLIMEYALSFFAEGIEADDPSKTTLRTQETCRRRLTRYLDKLTNDGREA